VATGNRWDRRGKTGKNTSQFIAAGVIGTLAIAIFGFFIWKNVTSQKITVNSETLCPDKVESVTAVLLDATDELSAVQREDIRNRLDTIKNELSIQGRIDLYTLGDKRDNMARKLFSMCNPGSGKEVDALSQNPRLMKQRWIKDFSIKLDDELHKALAGKQASESPIMEAIKDVAVQSFGAAATVGAIEKKLILASDMIEFTSEYNQYRGGQSLNFDSFAKSAYYKKVRTDHLRGVDVQIFYVRRPTEKGVSGSKEHILFWEHFFRGSGGRLSHFAPI
jgi:hypothetical protein